MRCYLSFGFLFIVGATSIASCSGEQVVTQPDVDSVNWTSCDAFPDDDSLECGTLIVPLDYKNPEKEKINISLIRIPSDSRQSEGVVLYNPGGPGQSGIESLVDWQSEFHDSLGLLNFDVVSFDPRGVDQSGGLKCRTDYEVDRFIYMDYEPDDDVEQEIFDEWTESGDPCVEKYGDALRHYSTENTARDMDMIRRAMGVEKISYLGISYGTYLGGVYATIFPEHVESMFLDAAYDPQGDSPEESVMTQAVGFDESYQAWVMWCEETPQECAFSSNDVNRDWFELEEQLDLNLLEINDGRLVNHVVLETATIEALYSRDRWGFLAEALDDASRNDGEKLMFLADSYNGRDENGTYNTSFDSFSIIECASGIIYPEPDDPEALLEKLLREAPWYSRDYDLDDVSGSSCSEAFGSPNIFEIDVQADIPIVVLGGTNDPATPFRWSVEMVDQLGPKARLVTFIGEGHAHTFESRCTDEIAMNLLVNGQLPSADTECNPDVPVPKPAWWDSIVTFDYPLADPYYFDTYYDFDPIDMYVEYFAIPASAADAFQEIRRGLENKSWSYLMGKSSDPVADPQWFQDENDSSVGVAVWLSSPEELVENQMNGTVGDNVTVAAVFYLPL